LLYIKSVVVVVVVVVDSCLPHLLACEHVHGEKALISLSTFKYVTLLDVSSIHLQRQGHCQKKEKEKEEKITTKMHPSMHELYGSSIPA